MTTQTFNESAKRVLAVGREHAWRLRHEYIGTEHLLLGILAERDGTTPAVLLALHVDADRVRHRIDSTVKRGKDASHVGRDLPFTSRAKTVLELTIAEAHDLGHASVGPEHLLLGLLREQKGIGAQVLAEAGARLDTMRAATLRLITGQPPLTSIATEPDVHAVAEALRAAVNASDVAAILGCWAPDGILQPPHHPAVQGHAAIAEYFRSVFTTRRLTCSCTASTISVHGEVALETLSYTAVATSLSSRVASEDVGKGLHVYHRQLDGSWRLTQDIWNSDLPSMRSNTD